MIPFGGCFVVTGVVCLGSATKVLELSDRFLELRGDSKWLVMVSGDVFYFSERFDKVSLFHLGFITVVLSPLLCIMRV